MIILVAQNNNMKMDKTEFFFLILYKVYKTSKSDSSTYFRNNRQNVAYDFWQFVFICI